MSKFRQIPESLLAKLWAERAARSVVFKSADGRRFKVIYPGRKGGGAGPDFRDAVLEEEGVGLIRGDVELHVRQRDWNAHGHGDDPRYNGVALHAVATPEADLDCTPSCGAGGRLRRCPWSHCWRTRRRRAAGKGAKLRGTCGPS